MTSVTDVVVTGAGQSGLARHPQPAGVWHHPTWCCRQGRNRSAHGRSITTASPCYLRPGTAACQNSSHMRTCPAWMARTAAAARRVVRHMPAARRRVAWLAVIKITS